MDLSAARIGWHSGFFFPVPRAAPVSHAGWDFMADDGAPVLAATDGTVVHVGRQLYGSPGTRPGYDALGHYVVLEHAPASRIEPEAVWTRYAHLRSASGLRVGQTVRAGDLVGYVGSSGQAPGRRRPRLFFAVERASASRQFERGGAPMDPTDFFAARGATLVGEQRPGPPLEGFEDQVPAWGGELQSTGECAGGTGVSGARPGAGSGRQDPRYARFGRTQLSDAAPYPPARYDELAQDTSLRASVLYWTCWLTGTAIGLYALRRVAFPRLGLRGLGACPCDTNPNGRTCRQLVRRALERDERRTA